MASVRRRHRRKLLAKLKATGLQPGDESQAGTSKVSLRQRMKDIKEQVKPVELELSAWEKLVMEWERHGMSKRVFMPSPTIPKFVYSQVDVSLVVTAWGIPDTKVIPTGTAVAQKPVE